MAGLICSEAALLAACIMEQHGYPPLLMTFESVDYLDHVSSSTARVALGSARARATRACMGASPCSAARALALSYFDPYIDPTGCINRYALDRSARLRIV